MHLLTLLLVMLFALVIAYFCYSVYFYGGRWVANPYNPRISSQKQHVIMGTLTDRDGTVLAYTCLLYTSMLAMLGEDAPTFVHLLGRVFEITSSPEFRQDDCIEEDRIETERAKKEDSNG